MRAVARFLNAMGPEFRMGLYVIGIAVVLHAWQRLRRR